jgi:DNA-binding NarL/FixJ family response regulator
MQSRKKGNAKMTMLKKLRIALIDDHPLFREGLAHLLETEESFLVAFQADSEAVALEGLSKIPVDFILLDLSLKESSGLSLLKELKLRWPSVPVLVVTMHDAAYYSERIRLAGGAGFLMKQEEPQNIIEAIHAILQGRTWFPDNKDDHHEDPVQSLSNREFLIFGLISQGLGTKEISKRLALSVKTVETHKEHIKTKLDLSGAADLLKFAIEWQKNTSKNS